MDTLPKIVLCVAVALIIIIALASNSCFVKKYGDIRIELCKRTIRVYANSSSNFYIGNDVLMFTQFIANCVYPFNCSSLEGPIRNNVCKYISHFDDIYLCYNANQTVIYGSFFHNIVNGASIDQLYYGLTKRSS